MAAKNGKSGKKSSGTSRAATPVGDWKDWYGGKSPKSGGLAGRSAASAPKKVGAAGKKATSAKKGGGAMKKDKYTPSRNEVSSYMKSKRLPKAK